MRRKKNNKLLFVLVALILFLGLGYAFLQTDLTINGTGKIAASSWDIHFEDLTLNPNNVTLSTGDVAATIDSTTRTDITYTITLKEPGDFYEFEVAVVNSGTIDAMIGTITNKLNGNEISITNPLPTYLSYTVTYSDNIPIALNHLLEKNSTETIKVRFFFRTDIDPSDLPTSGATNTLSFGLSYVQADANSVPKPVPSFADDSWETIINNVHTGNYSFYHVGDTKTIELGNSLGTHTLRIANTSTPTECETLGFSQSACGFVLEFVDIISNKRMNSYTGSGGGWPITSMRTYLNNTNDSTSIINSLPEILRNAIIDTIVVSGHGDYNGETNFTSIDKLYLLSSHEVYEDVDGNTSSGIDYWDTAYYNTRQLDYYAGLNVTDSPSNSDVVKKLDGTASYWWLRSAESTSGVSFHLVLSLGGCSDYNSYNLYGVSPAFRIG